jgi:hypothetical protein
MVPLVLVEAKRYPSWSLTINICLGEPVDPDRGWSGMLLYQGGVIKTINATSSHPSQAGVCSLTGSNTLPLE